MKHVTTIIIGGGQCGLAMSRQLTGYGIDHLILERGRAGNSWRTERWDGLKLLSPNWMNGLPGLDYNGSDQDGFMSVPAFVTSFDACIRKNAFPLMTGTTVLKVTRTAKGYLVQTDQGAMTCSCVVVATGACSIPKVPGFATQLPTEIVQVTPQTYKNLGDLPPGEVLVVGASASGLQLARDIQLSGRQVTLAVGNHLRLPRRYRGADIMMWMHLIGAFDAPDAAADDLERLRRLPSLPLIGHDDNIDLDLNTLQRLGVEITGRLANLTEDTAWFSGSLTNTCASADLKMNRLLERIDQWIVKKGCEHLVEPTSRLSPTTIGENPRLHRKFSRNGLRSVVWATGFRPDHSYLNLPVFDRKNRIQHDGGIVGDGLYVMGLPYLRSARSVHIDGASDDAKALAQHLAGWLAQPLAA